MTGTSPFVHAKRGRPSDSGYYRIALLDKDGDIRMEYAFPSVTHILDAVLAKPRLMAWYYNQGIEGISELLQKYGDKMPKDADSVRSLMKTNKLTPWHKRNKAAKRGSDIHEDIERIARGETVPLTADNEGFQNWWAHRGLDPSRILAAELPLVSFQNQYGGTVDLVYQDPLSGKVVLTDVKTGTYVHWTHLLQGSAYRMAWEEAGGEPIWAVSVLHVRPTSELKDGWVEVTEEISPKVWTSVLDIYRTLPVNWSPEDIEFSA